MKTVNGDLYIRRREKETPLFKLLRTKIDVIEDIFVIARLA